ncbi:MAG: D-alanyl-D-alanine carboxypeptidase/D-alanyl-D-alanine-endopeptidase [Actinobacteria bacterium]|nr:MAG: D-alanyl-D-alanine carboxypeptidase/D-alanyl-D-alanine-endopeptidase [Actinomycetota bacterium]
MHGNRIPAPIRAVRPRSRPVCARGRTALAALLAAVSGAIAFAAAGGAAAAASGLPALQRVLGRQLARAGSGSSAYVYDLSARQTLFSARASVARPPASLEKLYTATTALERLGPSARLATSVLGTGTLSPEGVWEGSLYLRGGGDPTFGSSAFIRSHYGGIGASVSALADQLARAGGIREITGSIEGDESYLDALRGEPSSGYAADPFLEGSLGALAFNRGERGSAGGVHAPAAYAARQLWAALRGTGVRIDGSTGSAVTPAAARPLASVRSPTIAQLLGLMLPSSDNFFAETLIKDLGARFGGAGTTAAGAAVVRATMAASFGLRPQVVDGSGLSRSDRTSTLQLARLLIALASRPLGAVLRGDLAVAGRTGTLAHRMRGTAAAGRCQAKTGTLIGASNLAGYCQSTRGHLLVFAFFDDGIAVELAHAVQDRMAIALAAY